MGVTASSRDIEGFYWALTCIVHHISSSGSIPHNLALVSLHSDDFRNFELLWVIF
jgi:hypothetical protein